MSNTSSLPPGAPPSQKTTRAVVQHSLRTSPHRHLHRNINRAIFSACRHRAEAAWRCVCGADPHDDRTGDFLRGGAGHRVGRRLKKSWARGSESAGVLRGCVDTGANHGNYCRDYRASGKRFESRSAFAGSQNYCHLCWARQGHWHRSISGWHRAKDFRGCLCGRRRVAGVAGFHSDGLFDIAAWRSWRTNRAWRLAH